MNKGKAVVSFSGGKDCTLALYEMMKEGYEISALLVTFDDEMESCFHKIPKSLMYEISESMAIPLVEVNCRRDMDYEKQFENALMDLKKLGITTCIFGDIDIENHRKWGRERCEAVQMKSEFPLWQRSREELVYKFLECNFEAVIKKVNLNFLSEEFLGRKLTREVISEIKNLGSDPCGENGEYHTIVVNGPIFKNKVELKEEGKEILGQFGYLKIKNK